MGGRHERTLAAVFEDPVRSGIEWREVESLFRWLGAEVNPGRGSRVRVVLGGVRAVFHKPHPGKEISRAAVRSVRDFLIAARVHS